MAQAACDATKVGNSSIANAFAVRYEYRQALTQEQTTQNAEGEERP
jgi:hypothetical protein